VRLSVSMFRRCDGVTDGRVFAEEQRASGQDGDVAAEAGERLGELHRDEGGSDDREPRRNAVTRQRLGRSAGAVRERLVEAVVTVQGMQCPFCAYGIQKHVAVSPDGGPVYATDVAGNRVLVLAVDR
jgi:hypothetical protein